MVSTAAVPAAEERAGLAVVPRIIGSATASPENEYQQTVLSEGFCQHLFGPGWATDESVADHVRTITRVFSASGVQRRQMATELFGFYTGSGPRTTGDRMVEYERLSYPLARAALEACFAESEQSPADITDFIVVSCTGHGAPGLDISLARDLGMPSRVRRLVIGHMGCYGALVALRSAQVALAARPDARVALLAVELCSLHVNPSTDIGAIAGFALFGDAAAALVLAAGENAGGPALVDMYCAADFATADQMSWKIRDEGFIMGLSRRIPITLRRNIDSVMDELLTPNGLTQSDIRHWIVHPGGPDILEVVGKKLELSEEQMELSWQVLREHGNCSSPTVLLILDKLLRSGRTEPGDWGVMMAFGPGLTLETCLLRF